MNYISYIKKINNLLNSKQKKSGLVLLLVILLSMSFEILSLGALLGFLNNISAAESPIIEKLFLKFSKIFDISFNDVETKTFLFLLVFSLFVVKSLLLILVAYKEGKFIYFLRAYFSKNLFLSYQKKPYEYFFEINSSKIVNNITVETNHLTIALLALSKIILETITFIGILVFLLIFNFKISSIIIILALIFSFLLFSFNKNTLVKLGKDRINILNQRLKVVQEVFGNIKLTKLKNKKNDDLYQDFLNSNYSNAENSFKTSIRNALARPLFEIYISSLLFVFLVYFLINERSFIEIIPSLGIYLAAGYRVMPSLVKIITSFQLFSYNIQSIDPINLDFDTSLKDTKNFTSKNNSKSEKFLFKNQIVFENVFYSYDLNNSEKIILRKINLVIEKNSHIGIIGETGSGKSTFVDLLLGLINPNRGNILVDNKNIKSNIVSWQNLIGYVPQDIFLNDSSIKKNIAYGVSDEKIDEDLVCKSLKSADIYDFVMAQPNGLNTELGEKGIKLSGGQKQRIAIARALYFDPEVLILDEATSSLDYATESNIIKGLDQVKGNKTLISITHRTNTLLNCDKIYEIKDKELIEKK